VRSLSGNTEGLKASQVRRLENLYRRRIRPRFLITPELARDVGRLSREIRRQIGMLIDRQGKPVTVLVGDSQRVMIPDTPEYRTLPARLKGLRLVHTHLRGEGLTQDDLTDLDLLRLDLIAAITLHSDGRLNRIHVAHLLPRSIDGVGHTVLPPLRPEQLDIACKDLIEALEEEFSRAGAIDASAADGRERALMVSVTTDSRRRAEDSLNELRELIKTARLVHVGTMLQLRKRPDPRFLMGIGKLQEMAVTALQRGATVIVFDQELNPSQIRSITDRIEIKVIDRTQLILDIFAQQAKTREGKLQVELAQLRYLLPRLVTKNTAMSRLTGGIGGRGPGETKLEINRRRVRDRISRLEKDIDAVRKQRGQQRAQRTRRGLPVISIIGYTNAGKSTLLNTLTHSRVFAENRLFATLDPSSRRLRFPEDREVIVTDTVGFIRDLPKELMAAFRATLEELESADLLLHVIDVSNPRMEEQVRSVEDILADLELDRVPSIRVLNKIDRASPDLVARALRTLGGVAISALDRSTLAPLIAKASSAVEKGAKEMRPLEAGPRME